MEKIRGIFKHFLISEIATLLLSLFLLYILYFTKWITFKDDNISLQILYNFLIVIFYFLFISSVLNLCLSTIFYFINKYISRIGSVIIILLVIVFIVIYHYTNTGPNLNVYYEHPADKFRRESNELVINIFLILIINQLMTKFYILGYEKLKKLWKK